MTLKATMVIAVLSVAATQYLSQGGLRRVSGAPAADPTTTGAIGARSTPRLDPCAVERRK